jgi:hypothetical protein
MVCAGGNWGYFGLVSSWVLCMTSSDGGLELYSLPQQKHFSFPQRRERKRHYISLSQLGKTILGHEIVLLILDCRNLASLM